MYAISNSKLTTSDSGYPDSGILSEKFLAAQTGGTTYQTKEVSETFPYRVSNVALFTFVRFFPSVHVFVVVKLVPLDESLGAE